MNLKKFKFYLVSASHIKHLQHQRGHGLAGAVICSINISHNTNIVVDGVEHQQTVNI